MNALTLFDLSVRKNDLLQLVYVSQAAKTQKHGQTDVQ